MRSKMNIQPWQTNVPKQNWYRLQYIVHRCYGFGTLLPPNSRIQRRTGLPPFRLFCLFVLWGRWKRRGYEHEWWVVMACNCCNGREKLYYQKKEKSDARWTYSCLNQSCTGRASFLQVCTVKPRIPETVIIVLFFTVSGKNRETLPYKLYAHPRNGKKYPNNYHFWGTRRLHVQVVLVQIRGKPQKW